MDNEPTARLETVSFAVHQDVLHLFDAAGLIDSSLLTIVRRASNADNIWNGRRRALANKYDDMETFAVLSRSLWQLPVGALGSRATRGARVLWSPAYAEIRCSSARECDWTKTKTTVARTSDLRSETMLPSKNVMLVGGRAPSNQ